ncbi:hypothetical protein ELQ87_19940 [Streptomyces griseoviridis]|uniref:Uncharacterized protein n=1 Tax=Streptomyces griseoviridis TaxID=45398 RepID=A0A3Q9KWU2_STRGD|nr:hypothetical protein [Streptomyces griseoviridis]AZS86287.1 hypothetical protein ELQ87_19940 [Streptomyces griseoviridis]QCN86850.1 hypothetical protein DDJ31_19345 [Streptomyces griseoviridis]
MLRANSGTRGILTRGRRGALIGASAAVLCLGGALAACGGGGRDGYLATDGVTGASAAPPRPTEAVTLVPLDGPTATESARSPSAGGSSGPPTAARGSASGTGPGSASGGGAGDADSGVPGAPGAPGAKSPSVGGSSPVGGGSSGSAAPTEAAPAALRWGEPVRAVGEVRWCEDVTVGFRNSGGSAVRSGTVTFGTHVIGALGVDWATVMSTEDLPTPIGAGARVAKTWTVCVDAWRVPWGMHVETRDVTVRWK